MARVLAQYMIDRNIPFLGFDTDRSHGALLRFYAGFASPVVLDRLEALDTVIESAVELPERRILVDLAAQTHEQLATWIDESGVLALAEETGISLRYWNVMDSGKDSVDLLRKLLDRFGAGLNYVVVRNQVRGNHFEVLEQSGEQTRAVQLGAKVMTIKHLHDGVVNKVDATSSSFWKAQGGAADSGGATLGLMDRQRLKMWMRDVYREIDSVGV